GISATMARACPGDEEAVHPGTVTRSAPSFTAKLDGDSIEGTHERFCQSSLGSSGPSKSKQRYELDSPAQKRAPSASAPESTRITGGGDPASGGDGCASAGASAPNEVQERTLTVPASTRATARAMGRSYFPFLLEEV